MADAATSDTRGKRPGSRRLRWIVLMLLFVAVVLVYLAASWIFADKLIGQQFHSAPSADFASLGLPEPEDVVLESDSQRLTGWFFEHPEPADCAVILLHGFTSDRSKVLPAAPLFWDRGCHILSYDLRSHGTSTDGLLTYGVFDRRDESVAVDWLVARTGLAPQQIGLMGWSYGAATSIMTAAERGDLAFVIADASYSSLIDIGTVQAEAQYGSWAKAFVPGALAVAALRAGFDPRDAAPDRAVEQLETPLLLVHSSTDDFTPYQHSEAIYAAADQDRTRLAVTDWGAPHARSYETDPVAYGEIVDAFMTDMVPDFGSDASAP